MRKIIFAFVSTFLLAYSSSDAQVTSVKYLLEYDCETNLYDVKLKVLEGDASSIVHRAQFNSQISIVIPAGSPIQISAKYFPIENNQYYDGTEPLNWKLSSPVLSPAGCEEHDFYSIIPTLAPAAFYNDMSEGDEVTLFSLLLGEDSEYDSSVRFFDNEKDAEKSHFEGSDLRNGFTIGSSVNIYDGNIHRACNTATEENQELEIKIYPNPATDSINIDVPQNAKSIKILDQSGKSVIKKGNLSQGVSTIYIGDLPTGLYVVLIEGESLSFSRKISVL